MYATSNAHGVLFDITRPDHIYGLVYAFTIGQSTII